MAERADLPRFIVYDRESRFKPESRRGPHARYVPCDLSELASRLQQNDLDRAFVDQLDEWLTWLGRNVISRHENDYLQWASLVGRFRDGRSIGGLVRESVSQLNLDAPVDLTQGVRRDSELSELFRALSFLVVDVSDSTLLPLYHYAHALMVPCIRLHEHGEGKGDTHLPSILRGHPAGYQLDIVSLMSESGEAPIADEIARRATAAVHGAAAIRDLEKGRYELQQRGYKKHLVFISHDLRPDGRLLVNEIGIACVRLGIDFWEYEVKNRSGEHWRKNLDQALAAMTHFVVLLSGTYEQSTTCRMELEHAIARGAEVVVLPFLLNDRARPNVDLVSIDPSTPPHHERILSDEPVDSAGKVVQNILKDIRR
jgi:hypothetical protein